MIKQDLPVFSTPSLGRKRDDVMLPPELSKSAKFKVKQIKFKLQDLKLSYKLN